VSVTIDVRGGKEARELLDSLSGRELQNRTRRGTRRGAAIMRKEVRSRAGSNGIPSRFRKTATRGHRNPVGTSTGPTSPLVNIFEGGAGRHGIGGRGQILTNLNSRREAGASQGPPFFARGPVSHPGMDARPLIGPVFDATNRDAADAAMDEILKGIR
jgi:hypothetical protein